MSRIEEALAKANQIRRSKEVDCKVADSLPPAARDPAGGKSRWWYCAGILLSLTLGVVLDRSLSDQFNPEPKISAAADVSAKPGPAAKQFVPPKLQPKKTRLPSSIPLNSPDPAYSSAHPGWQSYKSNALEYRVVRKENTVKAIQVITRSENAIADNLFTSFLGEIAGGESYKVQSGEKRNGFFVEKGSAGNTAEVLVYRTRHAGDIRAFVVAFL